MNLSDALAAPRPPIRAIVYAIRGRPGQNNRPALPAGHPITWGAIATPSCSAYPYPTFVDRRDDEAWRETLAKAAKLST